MPFQRSRNLDYYVRKRFVKRTSLQKVTTILLNLCLAATALNTPEIPPLVIRSIRKGKHQKTEQLKDTLRLRPFLTFVWRARSPALKLNLDQQTKLIWLPNFWSLLGLDYLSTDFGRGEPILSWPVTLPKKKKWPCFCHTRRRATSSGPASGNPSLRNGGSDQIPCKM